MGLKLELFDLIKQNVKCSPEFISNELNLRVNIIKTWCDSMVAEGLMNKMNNEYSLTKWPKKYLCKDSKSYIGFILGAVKYFTNAFSNFENNFRKDKEFFKYTPDQMLGIAENIAPIANFIFPRIISEIGSNEKPINVLDVGCGLGYYLFKFAEFYPQFKGTGIDIEPLILDQARKIAQKKKLDNNITFLKGNVLDLKLDKKYDLIILSNIIQAFNTNQNIKLFKSLYTLLNQNGKIIIIDCLLDEDKIDAKFNIFFNLYLQFESLTAKLYTLNELTEIARLSLLKFTKHNNLMLGIDLIIFQKS